MVEQVKVSLACRLTEIVPWLHPARHLDALPSATQAPVRDVRALLWYWV